MNKKRRKITSKTRRGIKSVNHYKVFSILLILVFVYFAPLAVRKTIIIKNISCTSQYGDCPQQILADLLSFSNSNTNLDLSKQNIENLLSDNFLVESYLIQYKIPSTLKVDIVAKKPKYAIKDKNSETFYLLDRNGLVLEQNNQNNLAYVLTEGFFAKVGQTVSDEFLFACKIIFNLNWLYSIKSGEIKDKSLYTTLEKGPTVIFPLDGDTDVLIGSTRLIYSRLNDQNKGIKLNDINQIDLRFNNPVLR